MNKAELSQALVQLARGFTGAAEDIAEHFFPEPKTVDIPVSVVTAEQIDAMKASQTTAAE